MNSPASVDTGSETLCWLIVGMISNRSSEKFCLLDDTAALGNAFPRRSKVSNCKRHPKNPACQFTVEMWIEGA